MTIDDDQIIWVDRAKDLELVLSCKISSTFIDLIEQTRFGGSGLCYRRLEVTDFLARKKNPIFVSLRRKNLLFGTYILEQIPLSVAGQSALGIYRSMLCVDAQAQGNGFGKLIVSQVLNYLTDRAGTAHQPMISFGSIESDNQVSRSLLDAFGAKQIGSLTTKMVYRQWPRHKLAVSILDASSDSRVILAQQQTLTDCGLIQDAPQDDVFYAIIEQEKILAGAHANIVRINLDHIGWPWDFLSQHVFAHIGPARRRFDPRNFTYLKFDGVVVTPGNESVWRDFLNTLLAKHNAHMAMFSLDPRSSVDARLSQEGVFGRFADATSQELAIVAIAHEQRAEQLLKQIEGLPLGIGPFAQ